MREGKRSGDENRDFIQKTYEATRKLVFNELSITHMPGLPGSIHLEKLSDGIVIVAGPNASGKTTSVRAMNYLLWTEVAEEELKKEGFRIHQLSIHGKMTIDGEEWTSGYEFGNRIIRHGHQPIEQLPVPPKEHQRRYNLRLSHLLAADDDREFAGYIHKEAMGGFDLDEAARQLIRKRGKPGAGMGEYKEWQKAAEEVRKITGEDRELRRNQQKRDQLEQEKEAFEAQSQKTRLFEILIRLRETEQELRDVGEQLASYSPAHESYHPQVLQTVKESEERIRELNHEAPELDQKIAGIQDKLKKLGFPDEGVPEERIRRLQELLRGIQETGQKKEQHRLTLSGAKKEREQTLGQIKGNLQKTGDLSGIDGDTVARTAALVEKESKSLHDRQQAESELRSMGETRSESSDETRSGSKDETRSESSDETRSGSKDETRSELKDETPDGNHKTEQAEKRHTAEQVSKGIDLLTEWIRVAVGRRRSGISPVKAGMMLLLALVAGVGILVNPLIGLTAVIPLVWWMVEWSRGRERGPDISADVSRITERFGETGLHPPDKWDMEEVKERLMAFFDEYQQLRDTERKEERRTKLQQQIKIAVKQLEEISKEKDRLLEQTGFRPDNISLPELHFQLHHILRYNEQSAAIIRMEEERDVLEEQQSKQREEFLELIREYLATDDTSESGLQEQFDRLQRLAGTWRTFQQELNNAIDKKDSVERQLKEEREQLAKHYTRLGLEPDEYQALLKLDERHGEYQKLRDHQSRLQHQRDGLIADIEAHPQYDPSILELSPEQALGEKAKCEEAERRARELQDELTTIDAKVEERSRRKDLGQALKMQETAREKLNSQFEKYLEDRLLVRMIEMLKKENQKHNYPEVFHRANELFGRFTENRYGLEIAQPDISGQSSGKPESEGTPQQFVAVDYANKDDLYPLGRLSEGTRIQLLLAVRLAFVEQLEEGIRLPFFADELLAVSDDARAGAIMDALIAVSREGRQVFYFTAQGDEVEKWRNKAAEAGAEKLVQIRTIGRNALYRDEGPVSAPALQFGYGQDVPDPVGQTHEQYGQILQVPVYDPMRTEPERLHPWYLTEDTGLIADCLRNGLMTWRQIRRFLEEKGTLKSGEMNGIEKLLEAGMLVEHAVGLWRIGRAAPIDGGVLRQSGAISEKFLPEADKLLKSVEYDPVRFLEEVDSGTIKGFRQNKKSELREFFEREGYLPSEEPLSSEELQDRIQAFVSDLNDIGQDEAKRLLTRINLWQ